MADWNGILLEWTPLGDKTVKYKPKIVANSTMEKIAQDFGWQCKTFAEFGISNPVAEFYNLIYDSGYKEAPVYVNLPSSAKAIRLDNSNYIFAIGNCQQTEYSSSWIYAYYNIVFIFNLSDGSSVSVRNYYSYSTDIHHCTTMLTSNGARLWKPVNHNYASFIFDYIEDIETGESHLAVIGWDRIFVVGKSGADVIDTADIRTSTAVMNDGNCYTELTRFLAVNNGKCYRANNVYIALYETSDGALNHQKTIEIDGKVFTRVRERYTNPSSNVTANNPTLFILQ